jgi:hypothetical protein
MREELALEPERHMHEADQHGHLNERPHDRSERDARKELKRLLGLQSLSGIVYPIAEIPVELIREIVDAIAESLISNEM